LSFPVIQEFETLMQDSIKEVINIHKYNFFLCGLASRARAGQALIAIPSKKELILHKPRLKHTTTQFSGQCTINQPNSCFVIIPIHIGILSLIMIKHIIKNNKQLN